MPVRRPLLASLAVLAVTILPLSACSSASTQTAQPDKFCPLFKTFMKKPAVVKHLEAAKQNPYDSTYFPEWEKYITQIKPFLPKSLLPDVKTVLDFSAASKKAQYAVGDGHDPALSRDKAANYVNASFKLVTYLSAGCHVPVNVK